MVGGALAGDAAGASRCVTYEKASKGDVEFLWKSVPRQDTKSLRGESHEE